MPRGPGPNFVMIHADFAFALLKALLDRPTEGADTDHFLKGGVFRSVTEVIFDFFGVNGATEEKPALFSRQLVAGFNHA